MVAMPSGPGRLRNIRYAPRNSPRHAQAGLSALWVLTSATATATGRIAMIVKIVTESTYNVLECPEWWIMPIFGIFVMRFIFVMFRAYRAVR
jgi:hypothetical protein